MTVRYILGFDGFGEAANATGSAVVGAGLVNHPAKPSVTAPVDRPNYTIGVSGLPEHKFGSGATLRNALAWTALGDGSSVAACSALFPVATDVFSTAGGAKRFMGLRLKRLRPPDAGAEAGIAVVLLSFGGSTILDYLASSGRIGIPNGTSQAGPTMELVIGQEYYIEIEMIRNAAGTALSFALFIDGVELARYASPKSIGAVTNFRLGSSAAPTQTWKSTLLFGDIYIGDERLGPQMILTRQPTRTLESNWTPSEGNDPLALLTGANADNDAKFITSPLDNAPDKYRMDFSLPEGYRANSAELYVRAKRNGGSDRTVAASVVNVKTGEEVAPTGNVPTVFSQNQYDTAKLWSTGVSEDLIPANINNLAMTLSSPKV